MDYFCFPVFLLVKQSVMTILFFLIFPQIFLGLPYGYAVDYFSLGIIVYELAVGNYPFSWSDEDNDSWSYVDEVLKDSICNDYPSFPMDFDMDLKDLIEKVRKHHL